MNQSESKKIQLCGLGSDCQNPLDYDDNDDDFNKLSGLPLQIQISHRCQHLEILSIYYTFWLSKESGLRLICPSRPLFTEERSARRLFPVQVHMIP